jgi:hypothetical protein
MKLDIKLFSETLSRKIPNFIKIGQTNKQTNKQTNTHTHCTCRQTYIFDHISLSSCSEIFQTNVVDKLRTSKIAVCVLSDTTVCTVWHNCVYCLTQLYDGIDMYRIYYIENSYVFRPLHWPSSGWEMKKLSKQLYWTYMCCVQWGR